MNDELHELNGIARRLLAFLFSCAVKVGGRAFSISPRNPETLNALGFDSETYMKAAGWLTRKSLGKWFGTGGQMTITEYGIQVAGDDDLLNNELPIEAVKRESTENETMASGPDKRSVFIIHGRNLAARDAIAHFLKALDLVPVDFDQVAAKMGIEFVGNIVLEGLNRAHGIVALFTPDEYAGLSTMFRLGSSGTEIVRWQSRPNVIFEAGIAFGTARNRTVLVALGGDVSLFSDVSGAHILRLSNDLESRKKFRQKLIGIGCAVDLVADSYTDPSRSGDFEAPVAGLVGVSPLDPFRPSK